MFSKNCLFKGFKFYNEENNNLFSKVNVTFCFKLRECNDTSPQTTALNFVVSKV